MRKTTMVKLLTAAVTAAALLGALCGCGSDSTGQTAPAPAPAPSVSTPAKVPVSPPATSEPAGSSADSSSAPDSTLKTSGSTAKDRYNRMKEQQNSSKPAETPQPTKPVENTADSVYDIEKIATIAGITAGAEDYAERCVVCVEDDHNPYDVVWDYGREYNKFIEAVDEAGMWDVLFDIKFYTKNYPMLAMLYHDDKELLLEHFQTVGIHEGRQGSKAFNVAAYMENCDPALVKAFGENYECYYLYWALNNASESKIDTVSDGHPIQMCVKLTAVQADELKGVNKYRAEVGVDPVEIDPEFIAFANYRAWVDYTGNYTAHAWLLTHTDDVYDYLEMFGAEMLSENTYSGTCGASGIKPRLYHKAYYNSPDHYAAMVSDTVDWFGCSNVYWGYGVNNDGFRYCQYDLYTQSLSTYMNP